MFWSQLSKWGLIVLQITLIHNHFDDVDDDHDMGCYEFFFCVSFFGEDDYGMVMG